MYNKILAEMVSPQPADPQTLVVSGILTAGGHFITGPSQNLQNGVVTPSDPSGDVLISTQDSNGNILSGISFQSSFSGIVSYAADSETVGPPIIAMGAMPVVLQLPYSSSVETIQVSKSGTVIEKASIKARLLDGLILAMPSNAFRAPEICAERHIERERIKFCTDFASIARNSLMGKVARIDQYI